jgi:hypothetical protein
MTEEEIEQMISKQNRLVKFTGNNIINYLIYKIAFARAERDLYRAERNILVWNAKKRRNSAG